MGWWLFVEDFTFSQVRLGIGQARMHNKLTITERVTG